MGKKRSNDIQNISDDAYKNLVNQNYTGDVNETGVNASNVINKKLYDITKQTDGISQPDGWEELLAQADTETARANTAKVENQKILDQLEKEQDLDNIVKQNQSQGDWYSGLSNFFDSFSDRNDLSKIYHNKEDGKWYQTESQYGQAVDKEVPYDKVQKLIEVQAQKMSKSGGYQTGIAANNVLDKAYEDGIWGSIYGLSSLITRGVTGNWDKVNDAQMAGLWNRTKYYASNTLDILNDAITSADDGLEKEANNPDSPFSFLLSKEEKNLRNAQYDTEYKDIKKQGQVSLEKRFEEEKGRRATGDKLLIDRVYDWSNVGPYQDYLDQQTKIKQTISERAMELEGRKKKSFANVEDNNINPGTFKYIDDAKGINVDLPLEKTGGADGTSKSIWDMQKLVVDANGKPSLDENGQPLYTDKYSFTEKVANSNWDVLGDAYYLQDDLAQGVGTAAGFIAGGIGTNALLQSTGGAISKGAKIVTRGMGLEAKALNYTNKVLNASNKVLSPFGKTVSSVDQTAFAKTVNVVNDKVSKAMMTTAQSYLMSDSESEQIAKQVQKTTLDEQIDKYAKINLQEIAKDLADTGNFTSDATLFLQAQMKAETLRKEWANENPELFNEVLLQSQLAKEQARGINNINFLNNLTSAGLFVKGKSFARNMLENPFSKAALSKGAWTISREMVQEGLIEEGLINGFAQRAGEETGRMKFYNTTDFFNNDIASSDFAENVFAGALLGGLQTAGTKVVNLRSEYNQFREQKRIADELSKIGSLDTKDNIKKVIEYSLDKNNNEAIATRMNDLLLEGKEEEANQLADTLLLNKSVQAATSGTTEVLNKSLQDLMSSEDLTAEDKVELQKAITFNNMIADNYDAHIKLDNKKGIIENRGNREILEGYKQQINNVIPNLEQQYNEALERQIRKEMGTTSTDDYADVFDNKKMSDKLDSNHRVSIELENARKQLNQLQEVQDQLDDNYDYIVSDKGQKQYQQMMKDIKRANISKNVSESNVAEIKEELRNNNELTPEVNSELNQTVEEKIVAQNTNIVEPVSNKQEEFVAPDKEATVKTDIKDIPDSIKQKAQEFTGFSQEPIFDDTDSVPQFGDPSMDKRSDEQKANDNDALSLQPIGLNEDSKGQKNLINNYSNVMKGLNEGINNDFGTNLSAKEMFGLFASQVGFDVAEKHFNFFKKAFEKTGIQDENVNWDNLYSKYFDKMKAFSFNESTIESPATIEEVKSQDEVTNSIIQEDTKPTGYNQDNTPIRYLGRKIAVAVNKIPFLGVKYRAVFNEIDGKVTYINDDEGELNTEGMTNLDIVLNPDLLVAGRKFNLQIPQDWQERTISDWKTNDYGVLVQDTMTMLEWMTKHKIEENSPEWIDKIPMDMIIDGTNIGSGVHDVSWWNSRNIADFIDATIDGEKVSQDQAKMKQNSVIAEGREMTRNIRRNVVLGNSEMIITDREEGHTLSNADNKLNSIAEANPQADLAIFSPQGFIVNKGDNGNEYSKLNIINLNSITDKGHVFMLSRIGTEVRDGKNTPTYVAHKVHTNHNQENLVELAKSRQRLYLAADILNKLGKYTNPTLEQSTWAETVKTQVRTMTGVSIDNISMDGSTVQYIGLGKLKQLYPLPTKDKNNLMLLPQFANINNQKLPIIHVDGSVTNYKSKAGEGYRAMLMDNLHTQKKFYTIQDQEGNPMQVLDVQPRIKYDLVNKANDVVKKEKEVIQEAKKSIQKDLDAASNASTWIKNSDGTYTIGNNIFAPNDLTIVPENVIVVDTMDDSEFQWQMSQDVTEESVYDIELFDAINKHKEEKVVKPITEITPGQKQRVVEHLFHNILGSVDISKDFTNKSILNDIKNSFDNHLNDIKGTSEYEFLLENKDSILGLGKFSNAINTVKSEIESFLNQEFEENDVKIQLNDEGQFEKNNNKSSFENDVRTSLSTKLKMFFAGIPKDNSKVLTEEFAGLNSYYGLDEVIGGLQDMLVNVSNTKKAFETKIEDQINKNPDEFGFLQYVLDKFETAPIEIQKEILFRLNQTKNEMSFVMYSKSKSGNYTLMTYDANSKNPNIKTKLEWQENFKQSNLIENYGDSYRVKQDIATQLINQYNSWKGNYVNVSNIEYTKWLSNFGIEVSEKSIQDYKDGLVEGNINFPGAFAINGGVFGTLYSNLNQAIDKQNKDSNTVLKYRNENKTQKDSFNILTNNNNGFLKTLIDVEVNNTFNLASSMYIAGKTINAFSQPNYTTEQLRKLKDETNPLVNNLQNTAFAKNSLLLNLLSNPKIKNALSIGYISLQSLKQQGQKVYQDSEIVDLSSQDYDLLLQGFFENEGAYFKNQELEDKGLSLRETKMTFPTLSDSSQMFVFNTVGLDLKKGNFTFNNGKVNMNEEIVDLLYTQLVKPDLDRMDAYLKSIRDTNVQGLDLGSQLFTMIPSMNTLEVEVNGSKVKLLTVLHSGLKNGNNVDDLVEDYKTEINKKLKEVINSSAESKLKVDDNQMTGSWVTNGFVGIEEVQGGGITTSFLDSKYLNSRGTNSKLEAAQIAAYDFTINYYINQAQIQMLFAGDIANYVQDKQGKKFNLDIDGKPDVTKPKVAVADNELQLDKEQQVYTDILKATSVNMSKRLKELISPGNRIAESASEKYIQIMVNDVDEASNTLEPLVKLWYPELYQENKKDLQRLKELEQNIRKENKEGKSAKVSQTEYNALKSKLQDKFPDIADYFNITATDAQEYTTWQEHLGILLNQGRIQQEIYDGLVDKLTSQSKEGLNSTNKLTKDEKKIIFQPLKPLHAGMYFEDLKDVQGNITSKIQRYVYVKTSSFPLLPELTQGMELDNLRKNIEQLESKTNKKVRVSYQSGNKVGAVKNAINMAELYSDYTGALENKILNSSTILDRENFSIQQDKPFKTDKNIKANKRDEINRGTQFEKIILGNGINQVTEKIFPNKFDTSLLESLGIEDKDGKISGKDLYAIYTNLYQNEQEILRHQLYNSLGLNNNGNWVNSIETLEQIKNALNQRLSNQQDKEILELAYIVPETGLDGSVVNKYYSKAEIDAKGLKPTRAEFNIPIWMSPNSRKFESVLNSIVNNKLINLKLPGFSSPVASQEGFTFVDNLDSIDKTGIIFTDKFTGELTATHNSDGSLQSAQVLVASKFRVKKKNDNGKYTDELLDLTQYTKKLKDGRTILDMDKISPDLLEMFSFRIPTSAHQSGALIEIVGFLPHGSGDLMIVPKDHTTQLGEDYDIDTRYVYSQNYRIDSKNNVRKIDAEYIQRRIDMLDENLASSQATENQIDEILNLFDSIRENEEIQNIFANEKITQEQKVQVLKDELNHKLIENQLVDVYKSIFSSTNSKIQKMIGATLSTQFAEDTAEAIDNKLNSALDDSNFSIFDDKHQKSILKLGASGKLGIGVHSNWVVLNSLFQQMAKQPKLINGFTKKGKLIPFNMTIGNFTSNGDLGQIHALEPNKKIKDFEPRLLSVVNMESQNSSTDNQKLQIMGRRNENKYTINVFALMSNLGFDKDIVNGQELSLPSLFISQPIIRRYVELKEQFDSIMSEYQEDADKKVSSILAMEFGDGAELVPDNNSPGLYRLEFDQMKRVETSELTAQKLYDSLLKGNNAQQWAVYEKFIDLQKHGRNINKVQSLANIDSDGLGISFFNTINKKDALISKMTTNNLNIQGIEGLFGEQEVVGITEIELQQDLVNQGYIMVETQDTYSVYIKPTSPLNSKLISSIGSGYNLWRNILPFENEFIDEQITGILDASGKDPETKNGLELKYKVVSEMKDFIYSYSNLGIFDGPVNQERNMLFFDTDSNQSLASYLNTLKKEGSKLFNEPFFKDLEFVINKVTEPSLIKYTTNDRTNFNKNSVFNTFSILNDSQQVLPSYNGDSNYTYEKLAKDLTKYSLLANQENGAIGFRNYIPLSILNKYKVTDNLRRYSGVGNNSSHNLLLNGDFKGLMNVVGAYQINEDNTIDINQGSPIVIQQLVDRINTKYGTAALVYNQEKNFIVTNTDANNFKSIFTRQFFQHNPEEAKKFNWRTKKEWLKQGDSNTLENLTWFVPKNEIPEYISIRDSKNGKFLIFEKDINGVYKKLDNLGSFGYNEYSPFTNNQVTSVITAQPVVETPYLNSTMETKVEMGLTDVLQNIIDTNSKFKDIAELILPFAENIPIEVKDLQGMANGLYVPKTGEGNTVSTRVGELNRGTVYISQELMDTGNQEKINYAIMEEVVHALTVDEIDQYVNTTNTYYNDNGELNIEYIKEDPPAYVVKLVALFKEGSKHILNKYATDSTIQDAINILNEQKAIWNNDTESEYYTNDNSGNVNNDLRVDTYRTLNLGEFIAGVMLSEKFRSEMDQVQYRSTGKSILSQFGDVIAKIINAISPGAITNSVTAHTIDAVMNLLENKTKETKPAVEPHFGTTLADVDAQSLLDSNLGDPNNEIKDNFGYLQPTNFTNYKLTDAIIYNDGKIRLNDTLDLKAC